MNKCLFVGRLTADPETRYSQNGDTAITRFRIAVNRRVKKEGEPDADFLNAVAFGKNAENIGKYFTKGSQILLDTHVQTGSYTNKDGQKVFTTDFVVESWEFVGGKSENGSNGHSGTPSGAPKKPEQKDGEFVDVPETTEDLPWD